MAAVDAFPVENVTDDPTTTFTLPSPWYFKPEVYEKEKEEIFFKSWRVVCHASEIANPGDYATVDIHGQGVFVIRGRDGNLRAFYNVCQHRAHELLQGKGSVKAVITCPYHAWAYGTDGGLRTARNCENVKGFDKADFSLASVRVQEFTGFVFVNLDDDAPALAPQLHEADTTLAHYSNADHVTGFSYDKIWEGNWKRATENGMEFYHHMGLHAASLEDAMPARGAWVEPAPESGRFAHTRCPYSVHSSYKEGEMARFIPGEDVFTDLEKTSSYAIGLFPNISLAMSIDSNNWLSFIPLGPDRTRVIGGYIVQPGYDAAHPEGAARRNQLLYDVNEEDAQATWRLQQVLRSTKAAPGPLNVREGTCAQFYKYLGRTLAGDRLSGLQAAE